MMNATTEKSKALAIWEQIELFLICGPFIFGWILGILRHPRKSPVFLLAFQNLLTFLIFLGLLTIVFLAQKITLFPVEVLYNVQSVLSLCYIAGNLAIAVLMIVKKKSFVAASVVSLLDKVSLFIAQSINKFTEMRP